MITLCLLLILMLAVLIIVGVGALCWPIILIAAVLVATDVLLFKLIFRKRKKE